MEDKLNKQRCVDLFWVGSDEPITSRSAQILKLNVLDAGVFTQDRGGSQPTDEGRLSVSGQVRCRFCQDIFTK